MRKLRNPAEKSGDLKVRIDQLTHNSCFFGFFSLSLLLKKSTLVGLFGQRLLRSTCFLPLGNSQAQQNATRRPTPTKEWFLYLFFNPRTPQKVNSKYSRSHHHQLGWGGAFLPLQGPIIPKKEINLRYTIQI